MRSTYIFDILPWYVDVHTPQTSHQIHWNENRTQCCELGENVVDLVVRVGHLDRDLREVIGMRARENLLVVIQILGSAQRP